MIEGRWPDAVADLLTQQSGSHMTMRQRASIQSLTAIKGDTTARVQQQYEENPIRVGSSWHRRTRW